MTPPNLELLSHNDHSALLEFEKMNQTWFESYVPARETGFYSDSGLTQHIDDCLTLHQSNEMLPMLIKSAQGEIVGRINLHNLDLDEGSAHLGYRIAQNKTGLGIATLATKKIAILCKEDYSLKRLIALAATNNIASQRTLTNNQFRQTRTHSNYTRLNGKLIHCIEYQKQL
ncbi:GNAT family N-acetyltransferase [Vibrio genomosp. F10]|uniref:GNAT family N-acetyltransferase n=1 Tax=Vibrio genomosp. F10 TaxID=723171 RepID=UPI00031AF1C4|nr:GNAT family N-acetyltransferase [Vibrio genomosp. F10]OEF06818.1 GNAT family N-acetyltransferase [Vibrio genomosp. F10 str. 9ZB36]